MNKPITLREVADRLGRSLEWMYRNVAKLRRDQRFPSPVPGLGGLYDPLAIDDWLAYWRTQQPAAVAAGAPAAGDANGEPDWAAIMDARAASFSHH